MRLGLVFAASLIAVCLGAAHAHALPDLEKPPYDYGYRFATPTDAAFTQVHHGRNTWWRQGLYDYYLFEPALDDGSRPPAAPVIVYIHGADAAPSPTKIREQITHYVRSGFTVVYPVFCGSWPCIDYDDQQEGALTALTAAFRELAARGHVPVARDAQQRPQVAFVAHSLGTVMATRMAAKLGVESTQRGIPAPQVLVLHDPAGYEQKVPLVNVDISRSLPLSVKELEKLRTDTQLLMLVAEGSVEHPNSLSTVPRLWGYVPGGLQKKKAYVVPHQCVKHTDDGAVFNECPTGSFEADLTNDVHTETEHLYYSLHDAGGSGALSPIGWRGLFDPTVDCVRAAFSGQDCAGAVDTDMGPWFENDAVKSITRPLTAHTPGAAP